MNKKLEVIEINWKCLGATLATLSDNEQYDFFVGFANEINAYDTQYQTDMQLTYIREYDRDNKKPMSDKQREVYSFLGAKVDSKI